MGRLSAKRASAKIPEVVAIFDQIEMPHGAVLLNRTSPSANEYAVSLWSYHRVQQGVDETRIYIEDQLLTNGFVFASEGRGASGPIFYYRKGEFEVRLMFIQDPKEEANFALSANWYGLDR